jgi:hypothetical protein
MEDLFVRVFLGSPTIWLTRGDTENAGFHRVDEAAHWSSYGGKLAEEEF